ncbi:MAG: hypothetical protein GXO91_01985, partial [FCB group bacterium]|nr:hypothetical protein [FCB group bacterium]
MQKIKLLILILFIALIRSSVLHVPDPYQTIQEGLDNAQENDTVLVDPGIYYEHLYWPIVHGIKLLGSGPDQSIIDGSSNGLVLGIPWDVETNTILDTNTVVKGFTIQNGRSSNGGGIRITTSGPLLEDLVICNNYCYESTLGFTMGGGVYISQNSETVLRNVTLRDNICNGSTFVWGGGLYCENSNIVLDNLNVYHNAVTGGNPSTNGLYFYQSQVTINN